MANENGPPDGMSLGEWVISEGPAKCYYLKPEEVPLPPADRYRLRAERKAATPEALAPFIDREIDLIYELPYLHKMIPAVYFLFYSVEVIYVGASKGVANRLNHYQLAKDFRRPKGEWTRIGVLPVPEEILFTVERHYIEKFWPYYNVYGE